MKPPFWLEVKKNYIEENFDNLVVYLKGMKEYEGTMDESTLNDDADFAQTYQKMKELVYDYMEEQQDNSLKRYEAVEWGDVSFKLRVMCAYLLTASMAGRCDPVVLAHIADVLLLLGKATTNKSMEGLGNVLIQCMTGHEIEQYGISWDHVVEWDAKSSEALCMLIGSTTFRHKPQGNYLYEGKGCLMMEGGKMVLTPMNRFTYKKTENKRIQFDLSQYRVEVAQNTYGGRTPTFDRLLTVCDNLIMQQNNAQPSPVEEKRRYVDGDRLVAKVTGYYEYGIEVTTVDRRYETVTGRVYCNDTQMYNLKSEDYKQYLKIGKHVWVTRQEDNRSNIPFKMLPSMVTFYERYARQCDRSTVGIAIKPYLLGYRWLTHDGIIVNVMGNDLDDNIKEAIENQRPVALDIQECTHDRNDHFVVNAKYNYYDEIIDEDWSGKEEFIEEAKMNLLDAMVADAEDNIPVDAEPEKEYEPLGVNYIRALSHLKYVEAQMTAQTMSRYQQLYIARFLSLLIDNSDDSDYIAAEMSYQQSLVRFASGSAPQTIDFEPKESMRDLPSMQWRQSMVEMLHSLEETGRTMNMLVYRNMSKEEQLEALKGLISSSNELNGKINPQEINRIKKQIAKLLGVEDEFVNTLSQMTYYGEESDTLEFKSSAVFPPDNNGQAEPTRQMWTLLKTICGFLNTTYGGELLLGVNDSGNSCGLADDLKYLHENHHIEEATMDRYRNYIKHKADTAFCDTASRCEGIEITATRVNYIIERDNEQHDILRIQIHPYEYGVVTLKPDSRPEYIEESYIRTSGATVAMSEALKRQTLQRKSSAQYDENMNKLILLQRAHNEQKQVRLCRYISQSGVRDRIVEPYKRLAENDAYLCYDTSIEANQNPIREFKIARITKVEILSQGWQNTRRHKDLSVDIFGMLQSATDVPYNITLKLAPLAYTLLREGQKNAEKYITHNQDASDCDKYPWLLKTTISKSEGVGRYYIGLAPYIKIEEGEPLKAYVKKYIEQCFTTEEW